MTTIPQIALGSQGLHVSAQGLGCMSMTPFATTNIYGPVDEAESQRTIHRALELGVNLLDTADIYGPWLNEQLVGRAVAGQRARYTLATKVGGEIGAQGQPTGQVNGRPDYVRRAIEQSLRNLGTEYIDLYYLHRLDPATPIEETVGAMSQLVAEGKVRCLGVSNVTADELRRAHATHPLTALQSQYSLFDRTVEENGALAACRELNIGFVAYSPLSQGFLSGEIKRADDFEPTDIRRTFPRFQGENFRKNLELVHAVQTLATQKHVTPAQLALAWVMAQGAVPIPGTKRRGYLEQNAAATAITLSSQELADLDAILPVGSATGTAM